jgi:UDP-N-acetylmuramoyl-tripeptide--D-alanyl-D-alanine ligase
MSALWTSALAQKATGGDLSGPVWQAAGLSIDSRTVEGGDLFIALQGPHHDGHDHIKASLAAGAVAAMAHRRPAGLESDAPLLMVEDTLAGLRGLALSARERTSARIVAVTGSVGKTGSKDMLRLALGGAEICHASVGSFNNHWGVPLSLARLPADKGFAVFEIGMNHAGEITPLTLMVRPHIAVITTVEAVHLEFFASVAGIAEAKAEIFQGVVAGGTAVLPRDNKYYPLLRERAGQAGIDRVFTFGSHIDADARLLDYSVHADHTRVLALINDRPIDYLIGAAGRPWALNSLAVLCAATEAGRDLEEAAASLARMQPPKGRGARQTLPWGKGAITVIDESYNASPVSVRAALVTLAGLVPQSGGRRIAVLGDMLELGEAGPSLHADLADLIEPGMVDLLFTAGSLMAGLALRTGAKLRGGHAPDSTQLAPMVAAALRSGDVVMIKGSAGSRMGLIVSHLTELAVPMAPVANGH